MGIEKLHTHILKTRTHQLIDEIMTLGANVPTIGGLHTGFTCGDEWGCEAIQIYLTGSRMWYVPKLEPGEAELFKRAWSQSCVADVVSHIPFLVNLASPDPALFDKSLTRLKKEIIRAKELEVKYIVLHPGSYTTSSRQEGLESTIRGLKEVLALLEGDSVKLCLETMAGQGTMLGVDFWELALILERLEYPEGLGVCFDTGHVFMAGHDIRGDYSAVMKRFDEDIGIDKIKVIHLNDSKTKFNSHVDRHANIGEGELGIGTFKKILQDEGLKDVPKVLEIPDTNGKTKDNLELLRKMVEK